jgi:hypothetical protein
MNKKSLFTFKIRKHQVQKSGLVLPVLCLLLFSACGVQNELNATSLPLSLTQQVETPQARSTNITLTTTKPLATSEPSATILAMSPPSPTPTETLAINLPTPTATETVTPLPTPTLSAEELGQEWETIDAQVAAAMASNNGCQLPCWWGIEPGNWVGDGHQVFNTINENGWVVSSAQWGEWQQTGFFEHNYRNRNGDYLFSYFVVDLITKMDQVNLIRIFLQPHTNSDPTLEQYNDVNELLSRDWEQYSVKNMFETFGEPDLIHVLPRDYGNEQYYDVNIYYPDLGIAFSYFPQVSVNEQGQRTICLDTFDMLSMTMYLYDPSTELSPGYLQATYPLWPLSPELRQEDPQIEASDLERRTGMSINEFVKFVLESENDDVCFTVN